jgi:thiopeptide-type bacteriocin biosynthesis protein
MACSKFESGRRVTTFRELSLEDPAQAAAFRAGMVEELRKQHAIRSEPVAAAFATVPRHLFAPGEPLDKAYAPEGIIEAKRGAGGLVLSVMSAAHLQGVMLEQAAIEPGMRVLEIGSGGYEAALIQELVGERGQVTTVDIDADITRRAEACLQAAGYDSASVVLADAEAGVPGEVASRGDGHLPGCDGRIYLKLYGPREQQDIILTRHLPSLASQLGDSARWWFMRYHDPEDHLRLRFARLPAGTDNAAGQIGAWTQALRQAGLVTRVTWDTYYPETARFGGTAAMIKAEEMFAADSRTALSQLTACAENSALDTRALTAASLADIATGLIGNEHDAMLWLVKHTRPDSSPPPRALYDQALAWPLQQEIRCHHAQRIPDPGRKARSVNRAYTRSDRHDRTGPRRNRPHSAVIPLAGDTDR